MPRIPPRYTTILATIDAAAPTSPARPRRFRPAAYARKRERHRPEREVTWPDSGTDAIAAIASQRRRVSSAQSESGRSIATAPSRWPPDVWIERYGASENASPPTSASRAGGGATGATRRRRCPRRGMSAARTRSTRRLGPEQEVQRPEDESERPPGEADPLRGLRLEAVRVEPRGPRARAGVRAARGCTSSAGGRRA